MDALFKHLDKNASYGTLGLPIIPQVGKTILDPIMALKHKLDEFNRLEERKLRLCAHGGQQLWVGLRRVLCSSHSRHVNAYAHCTCCVAWIASVSRGCFKCVSEYSGSYQIYLHLMFPGISGLGPRAFP